VGITSQGTIPARAIIAKALRTGPSDTTKPPKPTKKHPEPRRKTPTPAHPLWVLQVLTIAASLGSLLISTLVFADLQLTTSFQQRLTVLAPKISEQEYKELQASWASMQSRTDYELLNTQMESLAQQHGIELPEPLLK